MVIQKQKNSSKKQNQNSELIPKRIRSSSYSKKKGNFYEVLIAKELRELGFSGVVTSRSESKSTDDNKVDLVDKNNELPCYIQLKKTQQTPSFFDIKSKCGFKDKPFIIIWNKQIKKEINICSGGEVVLLDKEYFYKLLKFYKDNS